MEKEELQKKYRELAKQLSQIGCICKGSISSVYVKCGRPYCRCKTDENAKHGPYTVWTRKVKSKTVTKYLSEKQANRCREYIQNSKKLESIIKEMRDLSVSILESEK
jgi:hypothetical protein